MALKEIEKRGGRTVSSISSKTTHLLLGKNGGSKKVKAQNLGIKIVEEPEFNELIKLNTIEDTKKEIVFEQGELF